MSATPPIRERISTAAREVFLRDGVAGVSMRKIADEVGVSAAAIYRHFDSKDALLSEIVVTGLHVLEQPEYFNLAFLTPDPNIKGLRAGPTLESREQPEPS
jgi:AcrR family transcriptional regulator